MPSRLSMLDAAFLDLETPSILLHTGGLGIFEGGLAFGDVVDALEARLHRVPLARKRLQPVALGAGRPVWVDDQQFELSYHLRHAALPAPGDAGQLGEFLSRLMSRPLDRNRPLWEIYVIEGLEGGRTGLFRKVHLAMSDGESSDPFAVLLDEEETPPADPRPAPWGPERPPSSLAVAAEAAGERIGRLTEIGLGVSEVMASPRRLASFTTTALGSVVGVAARAARPPPKSPLNRRLSPHRRFAYTRVDLDALRTIRRAFGGTINDVVVAVTADAVGRLLRGRGYDTTDLDLRVMVPVRVHGDGGETDRTGIGESHVMGEGVVGVLAPLPVMQMDPVARLYRIMGELAGLKESRQAVAAERLLSAAGYAPPNLHAMAARLASAEQRYSVALSNAPGPQRPRWLRGARMLEAYPFIPLGRNSTLSVAVSSYAGGLFFGLLGDRVALPDLDALAGSLDEAVAALQEAAGDEGADSGGGTR